MNQFFTSWQRSQNPFLLFEPSAGSCLRRTLVIISAAQKWICGIKPRALWTGRGSVCGPGVLLTIEGRGRVLASYDDTLLIRVDPGAVGQGLSLSLATSLGRPSGVAALGSGLTQAPHD